MRSSELKTLRRLRTIFLKDTPAPRNYWTSEADLDAYDRTHAQRIGWKWDYVLNELKRRGWSPPSGDLLDWGCGTGIATRKFLEHFPEQRQVLLWDRSELATKFAARRLAKCGVEATPTPVLPSRVAILLLSHVLVEQSDPFGLPCKATTVIIVEPGTHEASRRILVLRERLRHEFDIAAPCPHRAECPLLRPENERHWCHQFAPVPSHVFQSRDWAIFARRTGIDLRSLPLSYLVLDKRSVKATSAQAIGLARVYKGYALLLTCHASGITEKRIMQRDSPKAFRLLKKRRVTPDWLLVPAVAMEPSHFDVKANPITHVESGQEIKRG
ncbi:MAG: small ribosomal subunit Rsm22 family protein [Kiritimatiellae bacterium]|nr:small ribosomal subunit Rsm22 family protein [Kiritimatiellia bacterium]